MRIYSGILSPLWFLFLLIVLACEPAKKEPLSFSVSPHLGQTPGEEWSNTASVVIKNGIFNAGITRHPWWIKTTFKNPCTQKELYYLIFNNPHINKLEVYLNHEDSIRFTFGDQFPFAERIYQDRDFVIPLLLEGGESTDILVMIDKAGETLMLEPEILGEEEFWHKRTNESLLIGLMIGWMLIIFFFAVFFAFELKEWSGLFYAFFILSIMFWIISQWGIGFQFFWPNNTTWSAISRPFFNLTTNILFLSVILSFYPPKNQGKKTGRILWFFLIGQILFFILCVFGLQYFLTISGKVNFLYIAFSSSILISLTSLWYLVIQWRAKKPYAGLYLAGLLFLLFFNVILHVHQSGFDLGIPYFLFNFGSGFGLMGKTICLSVAFAKKAGTHKKEKENLVIELITKEKELADRLISVQEEERNRLARDLNDSIGGMLSSIYLQAEKIEKQFTSSKETIALKRMVKQSIQEARSISHNLTPPNLEEFGLEKTIQNLVQLTSDQNQLKINYYYNIKEKLGIPIQLMLYRICGELLYNVVKHARASELMVQLISDENIIEIIVEDDGQGMKSGKTINGIGLKNMRERVNYLKGEIFIDSNDQGTTVIIKIPINSV